MSGFKGKKKADPVRLYGRRAKLEQARDAAMLHALFFWQVQAHTTNLRTGQYWEQRALAAMDAAVGLDKELRGDVYPWEKDTKK